MEIILLERVYKLGNVGDVVSVKDGFARNFLIPAKKALRATRENKQLFDSRKAQIEAENQEKKVLAEKVCQTVKGLIVALVRQAGEDGRLFGSVNARDIAIAINEKGINEVERSHVILHQPIKNIGIFPVLIQLHADVEQTIHVNVARSEDEARDAAQAFLNPAAKDKAKKAAKDKAETEATDEAGEAA